MSTDTQHKAKVGSKGELFPPSKLRKILGLSPGSSVLYYIRNGKLVVEPIIDVRTLLKQRKNLRKITASEFNEDRKQLSKEAEN